MKGFHELRTRYTRKLRNFKGFALLGMAIILFRKVLKSVPFAKVRSLVNNEFLEDMLRRYAAINEALGVAE